MYAVKGNRQYTIDEKEKEAYVKAGYDIYDKENNKLVKLEDGANSKVDVAIYNNVKKELEESNTKVNELEVALLGANAEVEKLKEELVKANEVPKNAVALKAELEKVQEELTKANEKIAELEKTKE